MKKKIYAITLLTVLLLALCLPLNTAADNWEEKVTPQLMERLETADNNEIITVYVWMMDIDWDQVEEKINTDTGYNMNNIKQNFKSIDKRAFNIDPNTSEFNKIATDHKKITAEARTKEKIAVDTYIATKRSYSKEIHTKLNEENIKSLGIDKAKVSFSSQYSPMIIAELTVSEIYKLAASTRVSRLDLFYDAVLENETIDSAVRTVRAHTVRDTRGYDGAGIKIGQIESGPVNGQHATEVRSIMQAIAPGAEIIYKNFSNVANFYSAVESLISQGCSIINMSAGFDKTVNRAGTNWYTNEEIWVDHIEGPHGISFVKSAGNNEGNSQWSITSPGMAYNAITVGAVYDNETWQNQNDDTVWSYSAHANGGGNYCAKPDVMAPAIILPPGPDIPVTHSGTSLSAPVVSGVIAQIMEFKPYLKGNSRLVKAALTASCYYKASEALYTGYTGLTAVEGAGVINANNFYLIIAGNQYYSGSFTADELNYTLSFSGPHFRIGLAFARISSIGSNHNNPATNTAEYINLDMYLYRPNGSLLAQSTLLTSSAEQIYASNTYENYNLKIKRKNGTGKTVWYSVAWL